MRERTPSLARGRALTGRECSKAPEVRPRPAKRDTSPASEAALPPGRRQSPGHEQQGQSHVKGLAHEPAAAARPQIRAALGLNSSGETSLFAPRAVTGLDEAHPHDGGRLLRSTRTDCFVETAKLSPEVAVPRCSPTRGFVKPASSASCPLATLFTVTHPDRRVSWRV